MRNIFIFGSCAASYPSLGLARMRKAKEIPPDTKLGYWAMPAELLLSEKNYSFETNNVSIINPNAATANTPTRSIYDSGIENSMLAWMNLTSKIILPFEAADLVYLFASPIFPFKFIRDLSNGYNLYKPSRSLIRFIIFDQIETMLKMIGLLHDQKKKVCILEGPRLLPCQIDKSAYNYISSIYEATLNEYFDTTHIPMIKYPKDEFLQEDGFTKEMFRSEAKDAIHMNLEYCMQIARIVWNSLENYIYE